MKTISTAYVDSYAELTGRADVWRSLPENLKKRYAHYSAVLIHAYSRGLLTNIEDENIDNALAEQALHIAENSEMYEAYNKINVVTNHSYSDGVLSVSNLRSIPICQAAKVLIDEIMELFGISGKEVFRG